MNVHIVWLQIIQTCADLEGSILENCKLDENFLDATILPFNLVLGGFLVPAFWGIIVGAIYLKYHNAGLAGIVGVFVLLAGSIAIPDGAAIAITMMVGSMIAIGMYYLIFRMKRTEE